MCPIKPENRARYPRDWSEIRARILYRAVNRCEGIPEEKGGKDCGAENGFPHPVTRSRVVLTIAHLDHTPENNDPENLRALCQRCHNQYDRSHRMKNAAKTRAAKRPQMDFINQLTPEKP